MNIIKVIKRPKTYLKIAGDRLLRKWRSFVFTGSVVVCEICGWNGLRFFNSKCPRCNSLPRTRLIPYALKHFNLLTQNIKILHVAPNVNEYNYIRNNLSDDSVYDRLNIKSVSHVNIQADLTNTELGANTYDLSMAWHVLEHIPKDVEAIQEVYRILKPGGRFLVSVPIFPVDRTETYEDKSIEYKDFSRIHGHYDHCRSCGLDYFKRFEAVGFKTQTLIVKSVSTEEINKYGLSEHHVVWCFEK